MTASSADSHLSFRRYRPAGFCHTHDHAQIVLPCQGILEMEVGGRGGRVDAAVAAFVPPGEVHCQRAEGDNRFLIVDCAGGEGAGAPDERMLERLGRRTFLPLTPAVRRLLDFITLTAGPADGGGRTLDGLARHWTPLLLDTLMAEPARPASRLHALLARLEAAPERPWTVESMARAAGLSASRLHALFREELDQTPQAYVASLRLARVMDQLAGTTLPIAQIAYQSGYADQSALTRALRRAVGLTPAAYRRQHGRGQ
ncbi:AraC family transcriptional regulator [Nitrospirillum sp. BR 11164]|uniref:AraC family transcriptional regulator n=1 Tax=Nitrospirillum sp. BR 11164 TaxID=3104324 RepID=UPI002AFF0CD0|nr:AraC family transcriptional regulator [Nitrospirillum sp. BR 11164]MEA1652659.1 AraC family transcriptional regulator [Nitrospirillum sp. BR 11164]